jgi:hypothetical protein
VPFFESRNSPGLQLLHGVLLAPFQGAGPLSSTTACLLRLPAFFSRFHVPRCVLAVPMPMLHYYYYPARSHHMGRRPALAPTAIVVAAA